MRDLRDWYSYLEQSVKDARPPSVSRNTAATPAQAPHVPPLTNGIAPLRTAALPPVRARRPRKAAQPIELQQPLLLDLGPRRAARRAGRPPLTETREEIIRRLLDPELTLHEAAAVLSLSKATLRRYTDQGKLPCRRTAGGQRRFRLSDILALLEQRGEEAR